MAPQRSNSAKAQGSTRSGSLRQGTLSFASAKRSGSTSAKDSLKGKPTAAPAEPTTVTSIHVGGKRKYVPDTETEHEKAKEVTEELERERLDTEDPRWNKAYGLARAKMGHIQPGSWLRRYVPKFCLIENVSAVQYTPRTSLQCTTSCASLTCMYGLCLFRFGWFYGFACRSYEYGPCVGVTRMERWERAAALGLNPPVEESPAVLLNFILSHTFAPIGSRDLDHERR